LKMIPDISIHFLRHFPAVHSTRQIGNLRCAQEFPGDGNMKMFSEIYH
jgi:hypothetical protein